jgi:hypothetical protein
MRIINKLTILCFFLVFATGCETYKDYEIEYTPIYPLCGEWMIKFIDTSVTPNDTSGLVVLSTYNTSDNSINQMWIRSINNNLTGLLPVTGRFTGKINCDVTAKTFGSETVANTYYITATPVPTFTITNGIIVIDGYNTATGGKSDKITFTMTDSRKAGKVYTVIGFRRTRWLDDEV